MMFGHSEDGAIGHRQERKMRELIHPVLQTGYSCRSQSISMLRQRVKHLAVHVATHQIPDQLDLTGMICLSGNVRDRRQDFERNKKKLRDRDKIL